MMFDYTNVPDAFVARLIECGVTEENWQGWESEEDIAEGKRVVVVYRCKNGDVWACSYDPQDPVKMIWDDLEEMRRAYGQDRFT